MSPETRVSGVRDNFHWRILRGLGKLLAYGAFTIRFPHARSTRWKRRREFRRKQFAESMKDEIEQFAKEVMEAVNNAPDGAVDRRQRGAGARPLGGDAPQASLNAAVQKRVDAAEAAFPPSAPSDDGQAAGE